MRLSRNGYLAGLLFMAGCGSDAEQVSQIGAQNPEMGTASHRFALLAFEVRADSLTPTSSPNTLETTLSIRGKGLKKNAKVTVGGVTASFKAYVPPTTGSPDPILRVTVPKRPGFIGSVDVTVKQGTDELTLPAAFRFFAETVHVSEDSFGSGFGQAALAVLDANNDGETDYAVAHLARREIAILLGQAGGGVPASTSWTGTHDAGARFVRTALFDSDPNIDLLVGSRVSNQMFLLLGSGTGTFPLQIPIALDQQADDAAVADLDGDGNIDIVYLSRANKNITALFSTGVGTFAPPVRFPVTGEAMALALGDIDRDGLVDLAVSEANGQVEIFKQSAMMTFGSSQTLSGADPRGLALHDINQDGNLDLMFVNHRSNEVTVVWGSATGSFDETHKLRNVTGSEPVAVATADMDLDGLPDLIVANQGADTLSILRQRCTATGCRFLPRLDTRLTFGTEPAELYVNDVNADQKPDVIVFGAGSVAVTVLKNRSS